MRLDPLRGGPALEIVGREIQKRLQDRVDAEVGRACHRRFGFVEEPDPQATDEHGRTEAFGGTRSASTGWRESPRESWRALTVEGSHRPASQAPGIRGAWLDRVAGEYRRALRDDLVAVGLLRLRRSRRLPAARGDEVEFVVLFGSMARGDWSAGSDYDVLVGLRGDDGKRLVERMREVDPFAQNRALELRNWARYRYDARLSREEAQAVIALARSLLTRLSDSLDRPPGG